MTSPTSLPNFDLPAPSRRQLVQQTLTQLGLEYVEDKDHDLAISVNDQQLYVRVSDEGPGIVRVFGQWQIQDDLNPDLGMRFGAAHHITTTHVLAKVSILEQTLAVAVDNIAPEGARYDILISGSIEAVLAAVGAWHRLMVEGAAAAEAADGEQGEGQPL